MSGLADLDTHIRDNVGFVHEVTMFQTADGEQFAEEDDALLHQYFCALMSALRESEITYEQAEQLHAANLRGDVL